IGRRTASTRRRGRERRGLNPRRAHGPVLLPGPLHENQKSTGTSLAGTPLIGRPLIGTRLVGAAATGSAGLSACGPTPSFSLIFFSSSSARSGLSFRKVRAFSLPCPSWSPSYVYQAPDLRTNPC